jgi:hypothetical protein
MYFIQDTKKKSLFFHSQLLFSPTQDYNPFYAPIQIQLPALCRGIIPVFVQTPALLTKFDFYLENEAMQVEGLLHKTGCYVTWDDKSFYW